MPPKLFRYRECSERQFDAFNNDSIYAVKPQMFNDPYDCLIRYNKDYLFDTIKQGLSLDTIKKLRDDLNNGSHLPEMWNTLFGEKNIKLSKILFVMSQMSSWISKNPFLRVIKKNSSVT